PAAPRIERTSAGGEGLEVHPLLSEGREDRLEWGAIPRAPDQVSHGGAEQEAGVPEPEGARELPRLHGDHELSAALPHVLDRGAAAPPSSQAAKARAAARTTSEAGTFSRNASMAASAARSGCEPRTARSSSASRDAARSDIARGCGGA